MINPKNSSSSPPGQDGDASRWVRRTITVHYEFQDFTDYVSVRLPGGYAATGTHENEALENAINTVAHFRASELIPSLEERFRDD